MDKQQMTGLAKRINDLVHAERNALRAKLQFTSYGRRDAAAIKLKKARAELNAHLTLLCEPNE